MLVTASVAASARTFAAPARDRGPVAHAAFAGAPAAFLAQKLLEGVGKKAGEVGFGKVLEVFGLGQGAQLGEIRTQLEEIDNKLAVLQDAVNALRGEVAQAQFSILVSDVNEIVGRVDAGMQDLISVARLDKPGEASTRKKLAEETLGFIKDKLLRGEQETLDLRVSGNVGADGLIVSAYKAARLRQRFWTSLTAARMRQVFDYFQTVEAELLMLRVEYMNAHRDTYTSTEIEDKISQVNTLLDKQRSLLKPSPPARTVVDSGASGLMWWTGSFFSASTWGVAKAVATRGPESSGWRLPSPSEIDQLIQGWSGPGGWQDWLKRQRDVEMATPCCTSGVWTNDIYTVRNGRQQTRTPYARWKSWGGALTGSPRSNSYGTAAVKGYTANQFWY